MERVAALPLVALLLLASCGSDREVHLEADGPAAGAAEGSAPGDEEVLYRGTGTVMERDGGAQLCFSTLDSYPPQCGGGVDLNGWNWSEATGYETAGGTRWGSYEIVGHWDGQALTVVRSGPPGDERRSWPADDVDRFGTPCPEPAGGWTVPADTPRLGLENYEAMSAYINAQPEYSASWVDTSTDPAFDPERLDEYVHDFAAVVTVARFTDNAEHHEAALRELWGGPLCVIEGGVTRTELERIYNEVSEDVDTTWGNLDLVGGRVELGVNVVDPEAQADFDRRYGQGVVVLHGHLDPVE